MWPDSFRRIPDEDWTTQSVESLALKYDKVERHGWYANLDPTVEQLAGFLQPGQIVVDYSGGTGILAERLLRKIGDLRAGVLIADSSPKFLRLALEKLRREPRVAFRLIRYLRDRKRLEFLDESLGASMVARGADAIVSTNAIHLYYDLADTLRSWGRSLRPGSPVFVQSGNIRAPLGAGEWIIDDTVEAIHRIAVHLVETEPEFAGLRPWLCDAARLSAAEALRRKIFLPARPLGFYLDAFRDADFEVREVSHRRIEARVEEWYEFLSVYHEGVVGWAGPSEKIDGRAPTEDDLRVRLALLRRAMEELFGGRREFRTVWTYVTCRSRAGGPAGAR